MTREEFLRRLSEALEGNISAGAVQDNLNYYNQYILDEVRGGKTEEEVLQSLGDPWAIARTIIDTDTGSGSGESRIYEDAYEDAQTETPDRRQTGTLHVFGFDTWWKKILLVLGIILFFVIIIAVVTGIIQLLAPLVIPVLVIVIVIKLIGGNGRSGPH